MSRLIDADALEMVMTQDWFLEILATQDSKSAIKKDIENCIDNIPTAYDTEKVVEQLEEASHWEEPTFDEDGYCNDDSWEVVYLDRAIDIVKRGGVE